MNLEISYAQFGVRPPVVKPIPEFLVEVGEEGIRALAANHYKSIKTSEIAHLFPIDEKDFQKAIQHAADFFIQICGGPQYFNQNRGAPMMLKRHERFRIDAKAREVWLDLYRPLLQELHNEGVTEKSILSFWNYLDIFSIWMINMK